MRILSAGIVVVSLLAGQVLAEKPATKVDPNKPVQKPATEAVDAVGAAHGDEKSKKWDDNAPATTLKPTLRIEGFQTPESVLIDVAADQYLVSNINGSPTEKDNNGFISTMSTTGKIKKLKWIEGGQKGVTLHAPKGSAIHKGVLYVADIDTVRTFDAKSGAPKADVAIAGATFLNDIAVGPDGKIYVSDSGIKLGAKGFEPTGTDAVWAIDGGTATSVFAGKDLGGPNGLAWHGKDLLVGPFNGAELYTVDNTGKGKTPTKLPNGGIDGLVILKDGTVLASSWGGKAIYRGKLGDVFAPIVTDVEGLADFAYDAKRNRLIAPRFTQNAVEFYDVK